MVYKRINEALTSMMCGLIAAVIIASMVIMALFYPKLTVRQVVDDLASDEPSKPFVFVMGLEGCPDCADAAEDTEKAIEVLKGYAEDGLLYVAVVEQTANDEYLPKITEFYGGITDSTNEAMVKLTDKSVSGYDTCRESYLDSMFVIEQYAGFEWYPSIVFYNGKNDTSVIEWRNPEEGYKDLGDVIYQYVDK